MTDKTPRSSQAATAVAPVQSWLYAARRDAGAGPAPKRACNRRVMSDCSEPIRMGGRGIAVSLGDTEPRDARRDLRAAFEGVADTALLPTRNRKKRLLISDMDSTIIQQECLDELAAYAGLKDEIAAITARAMAGELDSKRH